MKIKGTGEELLIHFESDQEQRRFEQYKAEANRLMPNLAKVWRAELQMVTDFRSYIERMHEGVHFFSSKELFNTGLGTPIIIDTRASERKAGRPLDARSIQASLKLLLFAPYEMVLEQEKIWRTEKYLAEVRDRCVTRAVTKAKDRAVRDANMCVARARRLVADFLERNPELVIPHIILCNLARDWKSSNELKN